MDKTCMNCESDDISLAELVYILIKRKKTFILTLLALSSFSFGYLFFVKKNNDALISVYRISEIENNAVISQNKLSSLLTENFYYEKIINSPNLKLLWNQSTFPKTKSSNLFKIETQGTEREDIINFHKLIFEYISKYDAVNYQTAYTHLEMELDNVAIKSKKSENIKKLITSAEEGKVLFLAESKTSLEGSSSKKPIIIALIFSMLFSFTNVFAIEFCLRMKNELKKIREREK